VYLRIFRHAVVLAIVSSVTLAGTAGIAAGPLRVDQATTCPEVRKRAEAKIGDIEKKIETLLGMKRALEKLTAACRKREPTGECPILEALGDD
jgi:hypothetical protein